MIGQQAPILVWRGRVVDGRKRLTACKALSMKPRVTILADADSPEEHAMALNLLRTHYTASQRAAFAERIADATVADSAKFRRSSKLNSDEMLPTTMQRASDDVRAKETGTTNMLS